MKIALVTDGIWPFVIGGMEKHSYYLAKYLASNGVFINLLHPPITVAQREQLSDLFTENERSNIEWVEIARPKFNLKFPGHYIVENYIYSKRACERLINMSGCQFIYAKGLTGWYYGKTRQLTKSSLNVPIGMNAHGYEMFQKSDKLRGVVTNWMLSPAFKSCFKNADFIFSYGGRITPLLKQKFPNSVDKIIELPTGIGADWINPDALKSGTPIRFVFMGRYELRKGIAELHAVIERIHETVPSAFDFIGPIPEGKRLPHKNVFYHGSISDTDSIKEILRNSDVMIVPSHSEGMPNVILEGMASGCAIIGTDVGAVRLMVDSSNGWLIKPGDITELHDSIVTAANSDDHSLLEKRRQSINRTKSLFLWDGVAKKLVNEIKRALSTVGNT